MHDEPGLMKATLADLFLPQGELKFLPLSHMPELPRMSCSVQEKMKTDPQKEQRNPKATF